MGRDPMGSRRTLLAIAATATSLAVVTAGCSGSSKSKPAANGAQAATSAGASPTDTAAAAFLAAWQSGDSTKARSMTDLADKAGPRLKAVMDSLAPKSVVLKLGSQMTAAGTAGSGSATPGAPSSPATPDPLANAVHYDFSVTDT